MSKLPAVAMLSVALSGVSAEAVIVLGPQGRNLAAPTGSLAGSGWDLQGRYGDFLGTPISKDWFITAAHFGGPAADITMPDGSVHPLAAAPGYQIPGTDLIMQRVTTPFAAYAALFNPAVDDGLITADRLVVFGRGTQRGTAIAGKGYNWGTEDHPDNSWGTNNYAGNYVTSTGESFLTADFDNNGDVNEGTLSVGDSGGGVFVQRNGQWKLVGINYGVDLFRTAAAGPLLYAAVYDGRGLYQQNESGKYVYLDPATTPNPVPQTWYASYIPDALGRILATPAGVPEPATAMAAGIVALLLGRRRTSLAR